MFKRLNKKIKIMELLFFCLKIAKSTKRRNF